MFRSALVALVLITATPVLALDMPLLTFPQSSAATSGTTTSTQNGK